MDLEKRVEKLERENRRLKIAGGAVVAVLVAVVLAGAVTPQQVPEVIRAAAFEVVDDNGTTRAVMNAEYIGYADAKGIPRALVRARGIFLSDDNGTVRVAIGVEGVGYADENGTIRATMKTEGIGYSDENGEGRAAMSSDGFTYLDENGTIRAELGEVGLPAPGTGIQTLYPAAMVLSDAEGKVIWQAPR